MKKPEYVILDDDKSTTMFLEKDFLEQKFENIVLSDREIIFSDKIKIRIKEKESLLLAKYGKINIIILDDNYDDILFVKHNLKIKII